MEKRKVIADRAAIVKVCDQHVCYFCKREKGRGSLMLTLSKVSPRSALRVMWCSECDSRIRTRRGMPLRNFKQHSAQEVARKNKHAARMREARLGQHNKYYRGGMFDD